MTSIAVVGAGYVGLVTAAGLASIGHTVTCVDLDAERVSGLQGGMLPFFEPGLAELVKASGDRLRFSTDLVEAVGSSTVTFIAVGTPSQDDGSIDLRFVLKAVGAVGEAIRGSQLAHIVVIKSTVVPGSTSGPIAQALAAALQGSGVAASVALVVNPEFLTEGTAVEDFLRPDRIVVGSDDRNAAAIVTGLYQPAGGVSVLVTTPSTAEMIKYASNTLLATLISFSNQISDIGDAVGGIDVAEAMLGVRLSRYLTLNGTTAPIGTFLEAGCGFGGSCLPKDSKALTRIGADHGVDVSLLKSVISVNSARPEVLFRLIDDGLGGVEGRRVLILGLAFKPDTDDVRESPALPLIELLLKGGAEVLAHDPVVKAASLPVAVREGVELVDKLDVAVSMVDAVVLVTRWSEYQRLPDLVEGLESPPLFVDGRRALAPTSLPRYAGIGFPQE